MSNWPVMAGGSAFDPSVGLDRDKFTQTVNAPATPNTLGAWVTLFTSLRYTARGVWLAFSTGGDFNVNALVDIAIGSVGNEVVICDGLPVRWSAYQPPGVGMPFIPVQMPAGVRVSMRAQADVANASLGVTATVEYGSLMAPVGGFRIDALNADRANSRGTLIPNAYGGGAITEVVASTAKAYRGLFVSNGLGMCEIFVGGSGAQQVLIPRSYVGREPSFTGPFPVSLPAGSRLWAQQYSGGGTAYTLIMGIA